MLLIIHLAVFSVLVSLVRCECILKTNDFTNPQPFFEYNGGFLQPTRPNNTILLQEGEEIVVSCYGNSHVLLNGRNDTTGSTLYLVTDSSKASCINAKSFLIDDWAVNIADITCQKSPEVAVEKLSKSCYKGNSLYGIGYRVNKNFYKLYEICFNEDHGETLYSHHTVYPTSSQKNSAAPNFAFIEGGLYKTVAMKKAYKRATQMERFREILGDGAVIEPYFKNNQYLARGHLAPRADFALYNMQKLSYIYANVAPQWAKFNQGDWNNLEEGLRKRVKSLGHEVQVYTGTSGVLTLPNEDGVDTAIYLTADENYNNLVPVPLYFYKVVYDPTTHAATAFVSINCPYYEKQRIEQLIFCSDICPTVTQLTWVKWSIKDGITSFCCRYSDFVKVIPHLGNLTVNSVFY